MGKERFSTSDLRQKAIINICDGNLLGYACDFEVDYHDGRLCALIVPRGGLFSKDELVIPWNRITCIGEDSILVKYNAEELACGCHEKKPKKKLFWD